MLYTFYLMHFIIRTRQIMQIIFTNLRTVNELLNKLVILFPLKSRTWNMKFIARLLTHTPN